MHRKLCITPENALPCKYCCEFEYNNSENSMPLIHCKDIEVQSLISSISLFPSYPLQMKCFILPLYFFIPIFFLQI